MLCFTQGELFAITSCLLVLSHIHFSCLESFPPYTLWKFLLYLLYSGTYHLPVFSLIGLSVQKVQGIQKDRLSVLVEMAFHPELEPDNKQVNE